MLVLSFSSLQQEHLKRMTDPPKTNTAKCLPGSLHAPTMLLALKKKSEPELYYSQQEGTTHLLKVDGAVLH